MSDAYNFHKRASSWILGIHNIKLIPKNIENRVRAWNDSGKCFNLDKITMSFLFTFNKKMFFQAWPGTRVEEALSWTYSVFKSPFRPSSHPPRQDKTRLVLDANHKFCFSFLSHHFHYSHEKCLSLSLSLSHYDQHTREIISKRSPF